MVMKLTDTHFNKKRKTTSIKKTEVSQWLRGILLKIFIIPIIICFTHSLQAQDITIGAETITTTHLPTNALNRYSYSQQIYYNNEINQAGKICAISFLHESSSTINRNISLYLGHTNKSLFLLNSDWVQPQTLSPVFYGSVTFTDSSWTTIYLDHPFDYNNIDNLVLAFDDNTGIAQLTPDSFTCHNTIGSRSLYISSVVHPNPLNTPGVISNIRNNIIFHFCEPTPMTNTTLNSCELLYADPGGLNNYQNNIDFIQTIHSDPLEPGVLHMQFLEFDLNAGDSLWIYDGLSIFSSLIGCYTNPYTPPTITATSHSLTFRFKSDSSDSSSGWLARISCRPCMENISSYTTPCNIDTNSISGYAAIPFCTDSNPDGVSFPTSIGGLVSHSQIGCLSTTINPTWYYMKIDQPGDMLLKIQINSLDPNPDVDFACWGPFYGNNHIDFLRRFCCGESELYIESTVGHYPASLLGDHTNDMGMYPINNLIDCSNSGLPIEYCFIPDAQPDAYYLLLLINNNGAAGTISFNTVPQFTQATTDCSLIALASNDGPICDGETIFLHSNFAPSNATFQWSGPNGFSSTLQNPVIPNANLNNAGLYSVIVSANNQISAPASTHVIVYPYPEITFYPQNPYICEGDSLFITAFGAENYYWVNIQDSSDTQMISAPIPTTYTVIGESNGCSSSTTFTLEIKENPQTNIVLPPNNNLLTDSFIDIFAITSGGTPEYYFEWSGTNVTPENNDSISVPIDSTFCNSILYFSLTVFDSFGCTATDHDSIAVFDTIAPIFTSTIPFQIAESNNNQLIIPDVTDLVFDSVLDNYWTTDHLVISQTPVAGTFITENGTVIVTVSDPCENSTTITIQIIIPLSSEVSVIVPITCNGANSGVGLVSVSGGLPPYSFSWSTSPIQHNDTVFNLSEGSYIVTITDQLNLTIFDTLSLIAPHPLNLHMDGITATCIGDSSGALTIHALGGTAPYHYEWSTLETDSSISNLPTGLYTVTVTDSLGCWDSTSVMIFQYDQPEINFDIPADNYCPNIGSISIASTISGGQSPYNYFWNCGGSIIHNLPVLSLLVDSTYCNHWDTLTFQVIDANGCIEKDTVYIHVIDTTNPIFTTLPFPIQYATFNTPNYLIPDFENLVLNNISDNCWNPAQLTITQNPAANTITTESTHVTVTITDPCGNSNSTTIRVIIPLSASITDTTHVSCNGSATGSATVTANGGVTPYSYQWNTIPAQSNSTASSLNTGNYTVTVTDSLGITVTVSVVITQPAILSTTITGTNVLCNGNSTGSATVTVSGGTSPYQFLWNGGATTQNRTNIPAGTYSVTVTDTKGCTKTASVSITQPSAITLSTTSHDASCGENNGLISITASGGVSPYQYQWSNTIQNDTINNLATGIYTCTVTDANNCNKTISDTIFAIPMLSIDQMMTQSETCSQSNGSIEVTVSNGLEPYQYEWSYGTSTTNILDQLPAGTYSVTVTDQDGCSQTDEVSIDNITLQLTIETINPSTCGQNNGNITIHVETEFADYTFDWGPIIHFNNNNAFNLPSGEYSVIVSSQDCDITLHFTIDELPGPDACFEFEYPYGNGINMPISYNNCTQNGDTWLWSFGDNGISTMENPTHPYFQQGDYVVTLVASNEFGCIDSTSKIITIIGESDIFIPNSFTPNDDGLNDIFIPVMREVNSTGYSLKVYNRYGQQVFISYNIQQGWDGKINGLPVEIGSIYSYVIIYENRNGKKMMKKGSVTVIQ